MYLYMTRKKKQHLYSDQKKKEIFGNIEKYLYICFNKKIKNMVKVNKNAEMENRMFDAAQLKNETIIVENGTITFYHRVHTARGTEWLSFNVNDPYDLGEAVKIMHNEPNGIDLVVDGKFIGYFKWSNNFENGYAGWKLFTEDGTKLDEYKSSYKRYCDNAVHYVKHAMYDYIKENYIDPVDADDSDENEIMEEMDDMYQYASEAAEEIENLADSVDDAYSDIIAEMKHDEPDIEYAMERVDDMYRRLMDIENELKWCLHRCDERTGCNIGWDDFCTADYFEPISIHGDWDCPSYSIAEFINDYNCDAADFMNTLIENIWKALGGQTGETFRNAIDDLDMPFYIAA